MCASEPPDQDSGSDVGVRRSQKHARSISNASSIHKSLPPLPCLSASSIPRTSLKARVKHSALRADSSSGSIITLHVYSGASSESDCPMFHEGEEIVGSVEMKLMKPASIKEVQVSARGVIVGLGKQARPPFVERSETLWNARTLGLESCKKKRNGDWSAQLKGDFTWSFAFTLPTHINDGGDSRDSKTCDQLPPSLSGDDFRSSIHYELRIIVRARHNISLTLPFIYMPITRPPYSPVLCPIVPNLDALTHDDDWHVFRSFDIRGTAFTAYTADVKCTFALAKPLHYTRGCVIPCLLTLESSDANILQLLANPDSPDIQLYRRVDSSTGIEKLAKIWEAFTQPCSSIGKASWTAPDDCRSHSEDIGDDVQSRSRTLLGQIQLPESLTPSFTFEKFSLKYEIQMRPFKVAGFKPEDGEKTIFFHTEVQIASDAPENRQPARENTIRPHLLHRVESTPALAIRNCNVHW